MSIPSINSSVCRAACRQHARRTYGASCAGLQYDYPHRPSACGRIPRTTRNYSSKSTQPPAPEPGALSDFLAQVRRSSVIRGATEPYAAYGGTEMLFKKCARQADYTIPNVLKKPALPAPKNEAGEDIGEGNGDWFVPKVSGGLGLPVTFMSWAQVMYLHMYILTVRLRRFPAAHLRIWEQQLSDHFSYAAEDRMVKWHGMAARGVRNKYLKDLWLQWRGILVSYDEGLIKGDAMLGAAVWRAIFKGETDADMNDVALVTAYLRREVQRMDATGDEDFARGNIRFGDLTTVGRAPESALSPTPAAHAAYLGGSSL